MYFGDMCSFLLDGLVGERDCRYREYFTLNDIKQLPKLIEELENIGDISITPYYISDQSIMELYGCQMIIDFVEKPTDKFIGLLSEAGTTNLEEIHPECIEQWDYTHYPLLRDDKKGYLESLERYISYMEKREILFRNEYDSPKQTNPGIFYEIR